MAWLGFVVKILGVQEHHRIWSVSHGLRSFWVTGVELVLLTDS